MSVSFEVMADAVTVSDNEMALEHLNEWMNAPVKPCKRFWKRTDTKDFVLFDRRLDGSFTPIRLILVDTMSA